MFAKLRNLYFCWTGKLLSARTKDKYILFVVHNETMFYYALLYYKLLCQDKRLRIFFVFHKKDLAPKYKILEYKKKYGIRSIPVIIAKIVPWNIIIYPDHDFFLQAQKSYAKKIAIGHGIFTGKGVEPETLYELDYKYTIDKEGDFVYEKIFVSSDVFKETGIKLYPRLSNLIVSTGSLMFDEFLKTLEVNKNSIKNNKKTIAIASTWGSNSLMQCNWDVLLKQIPLLCRKYRILFFIHPNNFVKRHTKRNDWKKRLNELSKLDDLEIVNEPLNFISALAQADLLIADHTSVSLFFLGADRPFIYLYMKEAFLHRYSPFLELREKAFTVEDLFDIESKIEKAFKNYKSGNFNAILEKIVSYKGCADKKFRKEIYSLLNISE